MNSLNRIFSVFVFASFAATSCFSMAEQKKSSFKEICAKIAQGVSKHSGKIVAASTVAAAAAMAYMYLTQAMPKSDLSSSTCPNPAPYFSDVCPASSTDTALNSMTVENIVSSSTPTSAGYGVFGALAKIFGTVITLQAGALGSAYIDTKYL